MALPVYTCQVGFTSGPAASTMVVGTGLVGTGLVGGAVVPYGLVDVSSRFQGFTSRRGRADEWSGITPGEVTVTLDDHDGAFDPDNASSAYYPNVALTRPVYVQATWLGVTYGLGYAYIDDIQARPLPVDADVEIHAVDFYKRLSLRKVTVSFPRQSVGARVGALLDLVGWPATMRTIDAGKLVVPAETLTSVNPLTHLDKLMKAEGGLFWIDGNGNAVYHDRTYRQLKTSRGTFGAGGLAVKAVTPSFKDSVLYNQVVVQRTGGAAQVANDGPSQTANDIRTYTLPQDAADLLPDDPTALGLANHILGLSKLASARIAQVELDPAADDALWPHVLGAEIGDMITLNHNLPGTKGITSSLYFIEQISHKVQWPDGTHTCVWDLSKADTDQWLIVGDAARGTVGSFKVGY